jgi:tetratricopeptide (TPR) repeat protein
MIEVSQFTRVLLCIIVCGCFSAHMGWAQASSSFDRGMSEFRAGNYSSAVTLFAETEAALPGTTDALLYEGKCQVNLKDFAGAESSLRSFIKFHPDSADAMYLLGFVLNRENRAADSLAIYTSAASITMPSSDDLKIVGLDYILLDDYADGIKWLEKSVAFDDQNKDAWYYLGRAYYTKGRLADARRAFQKVLELDPRDIRAEDNIGLIYETSGDTAAAIDAYRKAIAWQKDDLQHSEQPYVNLGNLLMEQGQTDEALGLLERAASIAPSSAYCHLTLGKYYRKAGRLKDAQRELEKATQLEPHNAAAHYQLGRLYKDVHNLGRAEQEFKRADELKAQQAGVGSLGSNH